jgi:hypothetical protein
MKSRRDESRDETKEKKKMRVERSSQGNVGDRIVIGRRPEWGVLVLTSRLKYRRSSL